MIPVVWAALGIGGSTLLGTAGGFLFSRVTDAWDDALTAFAAGIMLAAAVFGLFAPAMEMASGAGIFLLAAGAACGALFMRGAAALSGRFRSGGMLRQHPELMFVLAIALHKFPEGMAGGVGLGGMDAAASSAVVLGIALQNLPEGVVMIPPLLEAGVRRGRAACIALATGFLNAAGVFAGALWGGAAAAVMPFALSFAGGAMMDVVISGMLPRLGGRRYGALLALGGFVIMVCVAAAC